MILRIFKVLIGILLLPVSVAATQAFARQLAQIGQVEGPASYFLYGVVVYLIAHLVLQKPNFLYVYGHELAHAIATLICGGRVTTFHVSARGGNVLTSKSNFFIALFPYFFPTYTIAIWLTYFIFSLFREVSAYTAHFLSLMGASLTFHLVMTIDSMKIKQSDIFRTGYLFSVSLIYVLNVLLLSLILSAVFDNFVFSQFFQATLTKSGQIYYSIYEYLFL